MRRKVFKGRLLTVFDSRLKLPNGRTGRFDEIRHPGAALIVPFLGEDIVLIRQYRAVIGKYLWEFPAGILEKGETPLACAKRELIEETGYAILGIKKLGKIYTSPGFCDEVIHVYRAVCGVQGSHNRDHDEVIRVRRMKRLYVRKLLRNGRILDSKTIAALALAGIA